MDAISVAIGLLIGAIISLIAVLSAVSGKKEKIEPASRYTSKWSIDSLTNPRIVAEYLLDMDIPSGARMVVKQCKDKERLKGLNVRYNPNVKGCFILGEDRAIILAGPLKKDEPAIITVEKNVLLKLNDLFDKYWNEGTIPKNL
mgnify:FL=1